ncbi:MAG: hypothetical protein JRI68_01455 [Deltaproteobacteria bacterium]|nr:hypothetical protein [Deltaproteobacteria bacterium]
MRKLFLLVSVAVGITAASATTLAQPAEGGPAKGGAAEGGAKEVRRAPKGQTGISPYNEELAKGREAFKKQDLEGAVAAFQRAINLEPEKMYGYVLMAQAQQAKANLEAAKQATTDGGTKQGTASVQAKMLFLRADVVEQTSNGAPGADNAPGANLEALAQKWDAVKQAWAAYGQFVTGHTNVPNYQASSDDRQKKVDARVKREKDYGAVRVLIVKNEKERAKKAK